MNTYPLLENAPDHSSLEFIDYLIKNNVVVEETGTWLIIENCKYHTPENPWYTVFFKCQHFPTCPCLTGTLESLYEKYIEWEWLKKAKSKQTVNRFHIHLIKK